jgi:hypothetical protein
LRRPTRLAKPTQISRFSNWHATCKAVGNRQTDEQQYAKQGVFIMFASTTDLRRNVAAMFFAVLFSGLTVVAAVGPANVSAAASGNIS